MTGDKFCLKWNDFDSNFSGSLRDLRDERELEDISLVSDTGDVRAHKVVLAASSPLFRAIITRNPHSHPLLYLKGVTATNLNYVLDFIYNGEVNVAQDDLNSFLTAAEDLKIKGLTQQQETPAPDNSESTVKQVKSQSNRAIPKQARRYKDGDDIVEIIPSPIKHEVGEANYSGNGNFEGTMAVQEEEIYNDASGYDDDQQMDYQQPGDISLHNEGKTHLNRIRDNLCCSGGDEAYLDMMISTKMTKIVSEDGVSGVWQCLECDKMLARKHDMVRHVEAYHLADHPGVVCGVCAKVYKNRESLRAHMKLHK